MANPTTNYNFAMPTNSDLVKDLPADFEVFGQAVDTQMKTNADAAVVKSTFTTKGDLIAATGASTPARVAVGTNGQVLLADSTAAAGVSWGTPAAGSLTLLSTTTLSGSSVTISSISQSYTNLFIYVNGLTNATSTNPRLRINNTNLTSVSGVDESGTARANNGDIRILSGFAYDLSSSQDINSAALIIYNYSSTTQYKPFSLSCGANYAGWGTGGSTFAGHYRETTAVSSIVLNANAGSFTGGTVKIYGVN